MSIQLPYLTNEIHTKSSVGNLLQASTKKSPKDLKVVNLIAFSRFPVYLTFSKSLTKFFAAKVFPYEKKKPSPSFMSETRFSELSHPNVISMIDTNSSNSYFLEESQNSSYILLELAPYGNFSDLIQKGKVCEDEKLVRTYFHQLIGAIEYLHSKGIAHMDLKMSNLLLGTDYELKVSDFDSAYTNEDLMIIGRGTKNFRAPEVLLRDCSNPFAADLYSCGILLFTLITGKFPYSENSLVGGYDLYELLISNKVAFWEAHLKIHSKSNFNNDFKDLFESLVRTDPTKRATIDDIKKSRWYQGPTYDKKELGKIMSQLAKSTLLKEEDIIITKKSSNTI